MVLSSRHYTAVHIRAPNLLSHRGSSRVLILHSGLVGLKLRILPTNNLPGKVIPLGHLRARLIKL
jgi:hypothetical protein